MAEAGLDHDESWRCAHDNERFCPPEGCPMALGCARLHGWTPDQPTPPEYQNSIFHHWRKVEP